MTTRRLLLCLFCALLATDFIAGKKHGKGKKDRLSESAINELEDQIEAIETKLTELAEGHSGSGCSDNKVHFFFHGDEHHGDSHKGHEDGQQVHIDLHVDYHGNGHDDHVHHVHAAQCEMPDHSGHIHIVQSEDDDHANFLFDFDNIGSADTDFNVHVHEFGDMSDKCDKMGGHFAPDGTDIGDLGTLTSDSDGAVNKVWKNDTMLELSGPHSIVGRGIVVHDSSGMATACCLIGIVSEDQHDHDSDHDSHQDQDTHHDHGHHHGHHHGRRR